MGSTEACRPYEAVGRSFSALGMFGCQHSEIGFSGFDLKVKLMGQIRTLNSEQAVGELIELFLAFEEVRFGFGAEFFQT